MRTGSPAREPRPSLHRPVRRGLECLIVLVVASSLPTRAADEVVSVSPGAPTDLDPITVHLSGEWPDSCPPHLVRADWGGGEVVEVEARLPQPLVPCVPVATPYTSSIDIGRLPIGSYLVVVTGDGLPKSPLASLELEVGGDTAFHLRALDVAPSPPTAQDRVVVAATGSWPDGCVPRLDTVVTEGRILRLYAISEGEVCLQVISSYFVADIVGPLEEGEWDFELWVADRRFGAAEAAPELAGRRSLTVAPKRSDVLFVGGRFAITVTWNTASDERGVAQPLRGALPGSGETGSGAFWFFSPDNTELLVKVLDGCAINGHYWVYYSAATDVGFEVLVEDFGVDGLAKTYTNEPGETAVAVTDTEAFATCTPP